MKTATATDFENEGMKMMCRGRIGYFIFNCRFCAMFGTTPRIFEKVWNRLSPYSTMDNGVKAKHLLWALLFMKVYATEHIHASLAGCCEKTFRKWAWKFVNTISYLDSEMVCLLVIFIIIF